MNTTEFAALVVNALDEQEYFKKNTKAHPGDIAIAFATVAETIGSAMSWAIGKEHEVKNKQAVMRTSTLAKNTRVTYSGNTVLPMDEEIAPALLEEGESILPEDYSFDYSEYRWKKNS
jgi:hypothetical protein